MFISYARHAILRGALHTGNANRLLTSSSAPPFPRPRYRRSLQQAISMLNSERGSQGSIRAMRVRPCWRSFYKSDSLCDSLMSVVEDRAPWYPMLVGGSATAVALPFTKQSCLLSPEACLPLNVNGTPTPGGSSEDDLIQNLFLPATALCGPEEATISALSKYMNVLLVALGFTLSLLALVARLVLIIQAPAGDDPNATRRRSFVQIRLALEERPISVDDTIASYTANTSGSPKELGLAFDSPQNTSGSALSEIASRDSLHVDQAGTSTFALPSSLRSPVYTKRWHQKRASISSVDALNILDEAPVRLHGNPSLRETYRKARTWSRTLTNRVGRQPVRQKSGSSCSSVSSSSASFDGFALT
ncbi:uncharacterized protein L969DRAFT_92251 [Mixia osmundae IAM 14324]|uniref:Uncharacterized protein n=1 Tax=Mixia osmundae (strain CBS 9802 / IAM 14324 / JCM 22182 / KY 12970) TaxID=764103 RepID=G7DTI6_MIXOS|nr:uncharacterized protein L969DRAFT_92251 [Mixia osmundae IAM 14324]KEI42830.1 hypothetical protein L969DRAFT_92251 [Mixia osmundae IAM 14324]GAA93833.1 hypothetical protein E5Q_00479 [Mixia osmundae IAM 14324]